MKPQLASDADLSKIQFPIIGMPKIDGVRAMNINGTLTGRSLDPFEGFGITEYFSKPEFQHLDGEMILGSDPASTERLCSLTTGAMGKFKGVTEMADLHFFTFDYLKDPTAPYWERLVLLEAAVLTLNHPRIHMVPHTKLHNKEELDAFISKCFEEGYEGAILRNPNAPIKEGRPSKKLQEYMRVKPWMDSEMLVTGITEGEENQNEAKVNSLGRTERSSAQAGKVPNGMVGSLQGTLIADVCDPFTGKLLFPAGLEITISKGHMTQEEAKHYFNNPHDIIGHIAKFQHMTHGIKDLPRFGGFISKRLPQDM